MYHYVFGELVLCEGSIAVIDCGGVGYKLIISNVTFGSIAGKLGERVKLYTYLNVREDALELFGFATEEELNAYKLLTTVSGVGPKAAMAILSVLTPQKLAIAISKGDTKAISVAQGIGPKTAARIILELKDKLGAIDTSGDDETVVLPTKDKGILSDALNALLVLGYTKGEASAVLRNINTDGKDLEAVIREALKGLLKQ